MRFLFSYRLILLLLLSVVCLTAVVQAGVPRMIQYQGRLTDDVGVPLDTTVNLTFIIYQDSAAGSILWVEVHPNVVISDGLFTVKLGSYMNLSETVINGTQRWLGVKVGDGDPLTPRTPIVSTAYALKAQKADTASLATQADHAKTADTATVALNASGNGWIDNGSFVVLSDIDDTVGIGTATPRAPLEVQANKMAIIAQSHGTGTAVGVFGSNDNTGTGVLGSGDYGKGVYGLSASGFGGYFYGLKNYINANLGLGTETPSDMLHVYKNSSGAASFIRIQSAHATSWGETGLRIQTPQNMWEFRMDDAANGQIPAGGLGLKSQNGGEVMTWTENGRVGIGTSAPTAKMHVNGNLKVDGAFTADTLLSTSITDEAGLASSLDNWTSYLTSTWTTVTSRTITVPGPGYVVAMSSGYAYTDHGDAVKDKLEYGITASSVEVPSMRKMWFMFGENAGAGQYWLPISAHYVFEVTTKGSYTYYFLARRGEGDNNMWLDEVSLILIYLPTAYGTVSAEAGLDGSERETALSATVEEESSEADVPAIVNRMEALIIEFERLKSLLPAAEDE